MDKKDKELYDKLCNIFGKIEEETGMSFRKHQKKED